MDSKSWSTYLHAHLNISNTACVLEMVAWHDFFCQHVNLQNYSPCAGPVRLIDSVRFPSPCSVPTSCHLPKRSPDLHGDLKQLNSIGDSSTTSLKYPLFVRICSLNSIYQQICDNPLKISIDKPKKESKLPNVAYVGVNDNTEVILRMVLFLKSLFIIFYAHLWFSPIFLAAFRGLKRAYWTAFRRHQHETWKNPKFLYSARPLRKYHPRSKSTVLENGR